MADQGAQVSKIVPRYIERRKGLEQHRVSEGGDENFALVLLDIGQRRDENLD